MPTKLRSLTFIIILGSTLLAAVGCAKKKPPSKPSPMPATTKQEQQIREDYFRAYPDSRVGVVTATLKHANGYFVSVGDVPTSDFREGEIITFVDPHRHVLTTGTVVRILPDTVHVLVDRPRGDGRMPGVGDVAIKLPPGATTL
jgi:hypothetical protein